MPSSSRRCTRYSWYTRSASAWRPHRYNASISWPRGRSASGLAAVIPSSSPTSSAWRPRLRLASTRSSTATRRSSSSRSASVRAKSASANSANAAPRQRPSAWSRSAEAADGSPEPARCCASMTSRSNWKASSCSGSTGSRYPGAASQERGRGATVRLLCERRAEPRDVGLQRSGGVRRRLVAPQDVGEPVDRDDGVRVDQERGEQAPLLGAPDADRPFPVAHFERTQDQVLHVPSRSPRATGAYA